MLAAQGGELRKLFNTSGLDYRAQGLGAKLPTMNEAAALTLLTGNGNLVKRPFLWRAPDHVGLVGFDEARCSAALLKS
jgi:arsenate reductase